MNYTIRDRVMWRWGVTTFFASLLFSMFVAYVHPWNWDLPHQALWPIPPGTPNWLIWPLANTLLVLVFVWNETNRFFLNPFWGQTRFKSYLRAFLQAWPLIAFSSTYSLPTLAISSLALSVLVDAYFSADFDAVKQAYLKKRGYEEEPGNAFTYAFGSALVFFYTLVAFSGWNNLPANPSLKQAAIAFVLVPLIYLAIVLLMILALLLLVAIAEGLRRLFAGPRHLFWYPFRKLGQLLISLLTIVFLICGLSLALCLLAAHWLWEKCYRGTTWLLPAHQS